MSNFGIRLGQLFTDKRWWKEAEIIPGFYWGRSFVLVVGVGNYDLIFKERGLPACPGQFRKMIHSIYLTNRQLL